MKNMNVKLIAPIFTVILLSLPLSAYADWSAANIHPMGEPNFVPNQVQAVRSERRHDTPAAASHRFEPQHQRGAKQPQPVAKRIVPIEIPSRAARPNRQVNHDRDTRRQVPDYFRHDTQYYGHVEVPMPYTVVGNDIDTGFVIPDGYETVLVNGEIFYYDEGIFYQQVGDQLVNIPAVLGAVVDSIPQDYQIIMADGQHYLYTQGVYYQRVDNGFEVVYPPQPQGSDQE